MYSLNLSLQQSRIEHMLFEEIDRIEYMSDLAEHQYHERNDRISEAMEAIEDLERENFMTLPSREAEDTALVARLREVADALERKWK